MLCWWFRLQQRPGLSFVVRIVVRFLLRLPRAKQQASTKPADDLHAVKSITPKGAKKQRAGRRGLCRDPDWAAKNSALDCQLGHISLHLVFQRKTSDVVQAVVCVHAQHE